MNIDVHLHTAEKQKCICVSELSVDIEEKIEYSLINLLISGILSQDQQDILHGSCKVRTQPWNTHSHENKAHDT